MDVEESLNSEDVCIVSDSISMRWNPKNKNHYESRGYMFTEWGNEFDVKVCDLSPYSQYKVLVRCPDCGQIREKSFQHIITTQSTLCADCAHGRLADDLRGQEFDRWTAIESHGNSSGGGVLWKCVCTCGNTGIVAAADLKRGKSRSCGCLTQEYYDSLTERKGPKHPNWKAGLSDEERKERHSRIQGLVRERMGKDKHTCQVCDRKSERMATHHLYDWTSYPQKRERIDNMITLCRQCHEAFHMWLGGYGESCSPEDFRLWKSTLEEDRWNTI